MVRTQFPKRAFAKTAIILSVQYVTSVNSANQKQKKKAEVKTMGYLDSRGKAHKKVNYEDIKKCRTLDEFTKEEEEE